MELRLIAGDRLWLFTTQRIEQNDTSDDEPTSPPHELMTPTVVTTWPERTGFYIPTSPSMEEA